MYHTTPDNTKIYVGSAKVEIADMSAPTLFYPLGTLSALATTPKITTVKPEAINGEHATIVTAENETVNFAMQELDPDNIKRAMGDLTTLVTVSGTPVTGFVQTHAAFAMTQYKIQLFINQSYNASRVIIIPTSITVEQENSPGVWTVLTVNTDYYVGRNEKGEYGIIGIGGTDYSDAVAHRFTYTYTPIAKTIINQGGKTEITEKIVKITHIESNGRQIVTTYWKCQFTEGGGFSWKKDGSGEIIDFNVTLEAKLDLTRTVGYQLKQTEFIAA